MQTFLLILATIVLTCSSLAGLCFLKLFAQCALAQPIQPGGTVRRAGVFLVLALVSFGLSFGSARLLDYLFHHA